MSYSFEINREIVWFPGLATGTAYVGAIRALENALHLDAGFGDDTGSDVQIDRRKFKKFVSVIADKAGLLTQSDVIHDLICAVVPTGIVMLERAGVQLDVSPRVWEKRVAELRGMVR